MGLTEAERKGSPYPYETSYVPRLETVADCFFRFQHVYEDLTKKAQAEHGEEEIIVEKEVPPVSGPTGGGLFGEDFFSSLGETVQAEKPR
ncbi:hypothetical protein AGDE_13617 [Angomonas deanei]|uniref:Uncharacterized protein n=1 Tax=Angomonas deanei TaxID=59799 RepID=A0A7G2CB15_9TRYP|nr:hypothetical protein AGDE_13617 [Angomonas deanei]CAD2215222.1 hypothetical protein, conserved [Angomonas deanei]|eukprot:EPY22017.1 hypothetical protein AGDE_13617 [Angomonas deanei]